MANPVSTATPLVPDTTVADNSWALPRPRATKGQKIMLALLAASALALASFTVGVNVGKSRAPASNGGLGRNGGFAGFGGAGLGAAGTGAGTGGTGAASAATTTTTIDPGLGGLLPGLDAPIVPETAATAGSPTASTTTLPSS